MNDNSKILTDLPIKEGPFIRTANRLTADHDPILIRYSEVNGGKIDSKQAVMHLSTESIKSTRSILVDDHFKKDLGLDPVQITANALINEMVNSFDLRLFNEYSGFAKRTRDLIKLNTRWSRFLHRFLKISMTEYSNNPAHHIRFQIAKLKGLSHKSEERFFAVMGPSLATLLLEQTGFVYDSGSESNSSFVLSYGTLDLNIKIFINPNLGWQDNSIIVGRFTSPDNDGTYYSILDSKIEEFADPHESINTFLSIKSFIGGVGDRCHLNYIYSNLEIGKKPLWKKLIGA